MRNNIRIETMKNHINREKLVEALNAKNQRDNIMDNVKPGTKLHLALKISRFFELKIEDDFEC